MIFRTIFGRAILRSSKITPPIQYNLSTSANLVNRLVPEDGKRLVDFMQPIDNRSSDGMCDSTLTTYYEDDDRNIPIHSHHNAKCVYIETYGCQMNVSDSEIVEGILRSNGFTRVDHEDEAGVVLLNTCSIRDKAETRVWNRLQEIRGRHRSRWLQFRRRESPIEPAPQLVGVLGCMAERLKHDLFQGQLVDIVAGPDAYRDLPRLLLHARDGQPAVNVLLSTEETYADVTPVRHGSNRVSAYVSIMRGCNNMCSYCIVPWTRGRERSRPLASIVEEVRQLSAQGFKEVTLLGQNVNSYNDLTSQPSEQYMTTIDEALAPGFTQKSKLKQLGVRFAELLDCVSQVDPEMRIRFTSPHPKDFPEQVLDVIAARPNICKQLHMPAQSGSSRILSLMRRDYTREAYLELVDRVRQKLGSRVALSSDFISGFCGETEQDHEQTLDLIRSVDYDQCFKFAYSTREKTHAHRKLVDDVDPIEKQRRLAQVVQLFHEMSKNRAQTYVGTVQLVLVEGQSRRSEIDLKGRADGNRIVVFERIPIVELGDHTTSRREPEPGDYVAVEIIAGTYGSLRGRPIGRTTLQQFHQLFGMYPTINDVKLFMDYSQT